MRTWSGSTCPSRWPTLITHEQEGVGCPPTAQEGRVRDTFRDPTSQQGWQDLLATTHNAIVDAWDFLTKTPDLESSQNHRLKGELATLTHAGRTHDRWQHELPGGARIWFFIDGRAVHLIDVHTHHPNQTKG